MSRNDVTIDLELSNTSKLLDTSAMGIITPIAGKVATNKAKTPQQNVSKTKKVLDYSSDSVASSQV